MLSENFKGLDNRTSADLGPADHCLRMRERETMLHLNCSEKWFDRCFLFSVNAEVKNAQVITCGPTVPVYIDQRQ